MSLAIVTSACARGVRGHGAHSRAAAAVVWASGTGGTHRAHRVEGRSFPSCSPLTHTVVCRLRSVVDGRRCGRSHARAFRHWEESRLARNSREDSAASPALSGSLPTGRRPSPPSDTSQWDPSLHTGGAREGRRASQKRGPESISDTGRMLDEVALLVEAVDGPADKHRARWGSIDATAEGSTRPGKRPISRVRAGPIAALIREPHPV